MSKNIIVINNTNINRSSALLVLSKHFLEKKLGQTLDNKFVQLKLEGQPILLQFDDVNGDTKWDEAIFLSSFKPKEAKHFQVFTTTIKPHIFKEDVKAYVRHRHKLVDNSFGQSLMLDTMPYNNKPTDFSKQKLPPYLTEGPAWENDKVGFRKYFDIRNANDIWGKTTSKMVLDSVGINPDSIYHNLGWWGMDILKVGKSLGAGAIALKTTLPNGLDTVVRVGINTQTTIYTQIANGPLRAIFSIKYKGVKICDDINPIDITETISIWGGQYFFQNVVTVENAPKNAQILTGLPDFYNCEVNNFKTSKVAVMSSHGKQSENHDTLGLAIMTLTPNAVNFSTANQHRSDISNAYLLSRKLSSNSSFTYRFYSSWQKSDFNFKEKDFFMSFLKQEAGFFGNQLIIK